MIWLALAFAAVLLIAMGITLDFISEDLVDFKPAKIFLLIIGLFMTFGTPIAFAGLAVYKLLNG